MPKRAAGVIAAPAAKVPKRDSNLQGVAEGLTRAVANGLLDEMSAKMLDVGLDGAFSTAAEERHESQKMVIGMLEEVMQSVKQHAQGRFDQAASRVTVLNASKDDLDNKVAAAEVALKKALEEADEATAALVTRAKQVIEATVESKAKVEAKADSEISLTKATEAQTSFTAAVQSNLRPLQDGDFAEGGAAPHKKAILPLLEDAGVEESLLLAFPSSCEKLVSARTSFDTMVFQAVAQAVATKQEANEGLVKEQSTLLEGAARDVKIAEETLNSRLQEKQAAEAAMEQASANKLSAEQAFAEAQAAKVEFEPNCAKAVATREECAVDLDNFTVYNIGCFEILRDGASKTQAKAVPAEVEGGA